MKLAEKKMLHFTQAAVGVTGLGYGICLYLLKPSDPYAVVNHPLQPDLLHAHVLAAPLAVFGLGFVWQSHVQRKLRIKGHGKAKARPTGLLLTGLFVPLVASGYAVQVVVEEAARRWIGWTHAALSVLWIAGYLFHVLRHKEKRRARGA